MLLKRSVLLVVLAFVLGGCTIFGPGPSNIELASDTETFHPTSSSYLINVTVNGVSDFSVDWDDGTVESYAVHETPATISHRYHSPYSNSYDIKVTSSNGASKSLRITMENNPPKNFGPWLGDVFEHGEKVMLNMTYYTYFGCPTSCQKTVGAIDPDGDMLTFEWHIQRDNVNREEAVFGPSGGIISGKETHSFVAYWFAGIYSETAPIPLCGPVPQPPLAQTPSQTNTTVTVIVRDPAGAEAVWTKRVLVHDTCYSPLRKEP